MFVATWFPAESTRLSEVWASGPETPYWERVGPTARTSSFSDCSPPTTIPAISTDEPVPTNARVEMLVISALMLETS